MGERNAVCSLHNLRDLPEGSLPGPDKGPARVVQVYTPYQPSRYSPGQCNTQLHLLDNCLRCSAPGQLCLYCKVPKKGYSTVQTCVASAFRLWLHVSTPKYS